MKKIIALLNTIVLSASMLTGCGESGKNESSVSNLEMQTATQATILDETTLLSEITTLTTTETTVEITETTQPIPETESLTYVQENSIAWLNYLAMLSQEINASQHSKMFLEEAYAAIINNTNPANVNELTESYLVNLLDIIEKYRMIDVKRERLQYLYEQNKARAMRNALPNPTALLSATMSASPQQLIGSLLYMAVDSYESYSNYNDELKLQYLKDGWDLDDEAAETVHDNRKKAFIYMIDIVRDYNLPGELALNERAIEDFVKCKNNDNVHQQIQFLEANESTYQAFGNYWLLLAECYYKNANHQKCLDCIDRYEGLNSDIFRKDYYFARTLPFAITSAYEVLSAEDYYATAERYLQLMMDNLENDEWSMRYYCAEMYTYLYGRTNEKEYLNKAYDILINNVNYLVEEQNTLNANYLSGVKKVSTSGVSKAEKKKIEKYNESLENKRKTELPTVYEPLAVNMELLMTVANQLNISKDEQRRIENILSKDGESVCWTTPIRNHFSFREDKTVYVDAKFDKDELTLPVSCVSQGAKIKVTVSSGDKYIVYEDWKIEKIERKNNDINAFRVKYVSDKADNCQYHKNSIVKVEIFNTAIENCDPVIVTFNVSKYTHHYLIPDKVEFAQVS